MIKLILKRYLPVKDMVVALSTSVTTNMVIALITSVTSHMVVVTLTSVTSHMVVALSTSVTTKLERRDFGRKQTSSRARFPG